MKDLIREPDAKLVFPDALHVVRVAQSLGLLAILAPTVLCLLMFLATGEAALWVDGYE